MSFPFEPPETENRQRIRPPTRKVRLRIISKGSRKVELVEGTVYLIGSGEDADIRIADDRKVSRVHARLWFEDGLWCLRDLGSNNAILALGPGGYPTPTELREIRGWLPGQGVLLGDTQVWMELVPSAQEVSRGFHGIVGRAPCMKELYKQLEWVGPLAGVMLSGESGTGKTLVAQVLHELSGRKGEFVSINCGAFANAEMADSELFGHVKGAFTHGIKDRLGAFRSADGGTLFLDEFGDLPLDIQVKLLKALEEGWVRPVGSDQRIPVDVRVITATHKNVTQLLAEGKLRKDLYYRVNVFAVHVPALSERFADFPDLIDSLTEKIPLPVVEWAPEAISALAALDMPGNVRELGNWVQRVRAVARGAVPITRAHVEKAIQEARKSAEDSSKERDPGNGTAAKTSPLMVDVSNKTLDALDEEIFRVVLAACGGNKAEAGRRLGIKPSSLKRLIKRLGL
ncbi:MAG: sigma 54-interacting transcriptional regulator [Deltaproteobacteria bacterium]|nr:sigma 54-interacting transcriptional regulator [Deltaproteobacteria bacterium]